MDQIIDSIRKYKSQGGAEAREALVQSLAQLPSDPGLSDAEKVECFFENGNNVEIFRFLQERFQLQNQELQLLLTEVSLLQLLFQLHLLVLEL